MEGKEGVGKLAPYFNLPIFQLFYVPSSSIS